MDCEVFGLFREAYAALATAAIECWDVKDPWDNPPAYEACFQTVLTKVNALVERIDIGQ